MTAAQLQKIIDQAGVDRKTIGKLLPISQPALRLKLKNPGEFTVSQFIRLGEILGQGPGFLEQFRAKRA